jgi:hypothetical protein
MPYLALHAPTAELKYRVLRLLRWMSVALSALHGRSIKCDEGAINATLVSCVFVVGMRSIFTQFECRSSMRCALEA